MDQFSRRTFIRGATAAAAAGGLVAVAPLASASASPAIAARTDRAMHLAAETSGEETLVAHVKNVRSGELSLYVGEREVTVKDRQIAALLFAASKEAR